jgi:hypothetical protein
MDNNQHITGKHSKAAIEVYITKRQLQALTKRQINHGTFWHNVRVVLKKATTR